MGKLNQCGIGIFSGKVGNVVGARYKNQNIIRAYQPTVFNPKSTKQVIQRDKFATATALIKKAYNLNVKKEYGTTVTFLYQRWLQMVLDSAFNQAIKAPEDPSTRDIILPKMPKNFNQTIGLNYSEESLNIFCQSQVTFSSPLSQDAGTAVKGALALEFIGAKSPISGTPPARYFGCDYILPDTILCLSVIPTTAADGNVKLGLPLQMGASEILTDFATQTEATGVRVRGMQTSANLCGSGWNYIYKVQPGDAGTDEAPTLVCGYGLDANAIMPDETGVTKLREFRQANVLWIKSPSNQRNNAIDIIGNLSFMDIIG